MKLHKWGDLKKSNLDDAQRARVDRRVATELVEMSLADLRRELGVTQVDLAHAADMTQGQISSLEHRTDHLVSTLRRCVQALGGDIEVIAVVGDRRVKLTV
jgi:DNA-binding XRE family transcriptional regulator